MTWDERTVCAVVASRWMIQQVVRTLQLEGGPGLTLSSQQQALAVEAEALWEGRLFRERAGLMVSILPPPPCRPHLDSTACMPLGQHSCVCQRPLKGAVHASGWQAYELRFGWPYVTRGGLPAWRAAVR